MKIHEATEQAYKNGYEKGYDDGYRYGKNRAMEDIAFPKFLVRLPEPSKEELEDLLKSPVIIHKSREEIIPLYHNGWIPVTERLPDSGKCVLVYSKEGGVAEGSYNARFKEWSQFRWRVTSLKNVTHWMPLPEPPKVGARMDGDGQ